MQIPEAARALESDLRDVFGDRLRSLVAFSPADGREPSAVPTLAVVDGLTADDLRACASRVASWHDAGFDTPLLLAVDEFGRSLDAFPFEFGAILAEHVVVSGSDPFEGLRVDPAHLRHACERQARGHLLHLREGYLETRGRGDAIAELIVRSTPAFTALVKSVARLHGGDVHDVHLAARLVESTLVLPAGTVQDIVKIPGPGSLSADEGRRLFPRYLDAVEKLANHIDRWSQA